MFAGDPQLTCRRADAPARAAASAASCPSGFHTPGRTAATREARWIEVDGAGAPPLAGPPDTFWTGEPAPAATRAEALDIRDPRPRTFFRLGAGEMELDNLKIGAAVDAPTVSASMATALLAYSGIAVKMLVDQRLGAVLPTMFMVEYQPGGVAQPHDHPLRGDLLHARGRGRGGPTASRSRCAPATCSGPASAASTPSTTEAAGRVRWLETQSPQPPANGSYRFDRDWDYLAQRLAGALRRRVRNRPPRRDAALGSKRRRSGDGGRPCP